MTPTLYLHWTATPYDWIRPGHYHSIISGDGRVHRLHDYNVDLPAHTYGRNRNSVALSCACMGGVPDPWTQPPRTLSSAASALKPLPSPAAGAGERIRSLWYGS